MVSRPLLHRLVLLTCGALLLASCTSTDPEPTPSATTTASASPSPTSSPTPTVDPAVEEATAAILDAYRTYWSVSVAALADPSAGLPGDFDRLIVDKARASLAESVIRLDQEGLVMTGEPVIDPEVDSVTLGEQPEAHVIDCVDSTNWIPTFRDTGDPAASEGQNAVVEVEAWATVFDDRWVIREVEVHRDRPC